VNHLGLSGKPDWNLAGRIDEDEFTFVTNNRVDFIRLFDGMQLHAGLAGKELRETVRRDGRVGAPGSRSKCSGDCPVDPK
jgi:hypothetical protein